MALFEFECDNCGAWFHEFVSDPATMACPECGERARRVFSPFVYKGEIPEPTGDPLEMQMHREHKRLLEQPSVQQEIREGKKKDITAKGPRWNRPKIVLEKAHF